MPSFCDASNGLGLRAAARRSIVWKSCGCCSSGRSVLEAMPIIADSRAKEQTGWHSSMYTSPSGSTRKSKMEKSRQRSALWARRAASPSLAVSASSSGAGQTERRKSGASSRLVAKNLSASGSPSSVTEILSVDVRIGCSGVSRYSVAGSRIDGSPASSSTTATRISRPSGMNFSQTTLLSNLNASTSDARSSPASSTLEMPIELSSQHGLRTNGYPTVGVWSGEWRSSPGGTGTPAAAATAFVCCLSVIRAMHSAVLPTSGTPIRANIERY
mmetsp:Transcript_39230/g.117477  ORF Transcript_39230/g.117477 Transcript_39230/m.117477 type:complete len:272 (-) Transcript_39230:340-1155(-)